MNREQRFVLATREQGRAQRTPIEMSAADTHVHRYKYCTYVSASLLLLTCKHKNDLDEGAGDEAAKEPDSDKGREEDVTQESLASLVERTFVLAAAGNSYQMGIKAFISTIKEAYERGYTVPALTMEVSFVPTKTAGRDLHQDEVELRSIWIALVYLTLENANWPQKVQRAHEISAPFMVRISSGDVGTVLVFGGGGWVIAYAYMYHTSTVWCTR